MNYLFSKYFEKLNEKSKDVAVVAEENGDFLVKTYEQLEQECVCIQNKIGFANQGECIGILINNRIEFVATFLAAVYCGYSIVAINNAASKEEKGKIINENNINKMLTISSNEDVFNDMDVIYVDKIEKFKGVLTKVETAAISIVSYTSGTSGKFSKGVKLSYENIICTVNNYRKIYNISEEDKMLVALPLWHNYGMIAGLCSALHIGCCILLLEKWDYRNFYKMVHDYKATIFPGSPYMYIDIVEKTTSSKGFSSLRICDSGGDTLPVDYINKFESITGAFITEGYGLTETSSLTHFNFSAKERKVGSIGKCVDNVSCKIMSLDGKEVQQNEWGLLHIKGEMLFCGYVNSDYNEIDQDGWFNTNDIARVDSEGYYYIAGRYSDIKSLDNTVYYNRLIENDVYKSNMVERVFISREKVNNLRLECYKIYVKLKRKNKIEDLQQYVKEYIDYVFIDKVIEVDAFSLTDTGKIKRT